MEQRWANSILTTEYEYEYIRFKNKNRIRIRIYSVQKLKPNTNTNIFGSKIKTEYEYEYIRLKNKNRIRIRIYLTMKIFEYIRINSTPTMMTMRTTARKWRSKRMCPLENHKNSDLDTPPPPTPRPPHPTTIYKKGIRDRVWHFGFETSRFRNFLIFF